MGRPAWLSWYLAIVFGLFSILASGVTVVPGRGLEVVRDIVVVSGWSGSVFFASLAVYARSRPLHHWIHRSRVPRVALLGFALVATLLLLFISMG